MRQTGRAVRRHHDQRLKRNRRHYWGYPNLHAYHSDELPVPPVPMDARQLGKVLATPQLCSCLGCGNQRHNTAGWTPTVAELRWFQNYREQVEELSAVEDEDDVS